MNLSTVLESTTIILPEIALMLFGLLILIISPLIKKEDNDYFFFVGLLGVLVSFILNFSRFNTENVAFFGALKVDTFSAYFNCLFLIASSITIILSKDYLKQKTRFINEFYALILFCTSGMMILSSSVEFMTLFIGFEIMSISVYILSGYNRKSVKSVESGIKYLVLGGFASAVLLYGIALLYGATGSIFFNEIVNNFNTTPMCLAGLSLVLAGIIFKIGAVPLHQWVPDIYQGAPLPVTGYMSVAVKAAAFSVLLRILFDLVSFESHYLLYSITVVAILTMVIGNIAAIYQTSIKRMLAYSSIAHAGYALVGVAATLADKSIGNQSVLYYLFAYTFMNLGAFGILTYLSSEDRDCDLFEHIAGLWNRKPLTAIALGIFMFSLAGIPPTIGFFGKYRVFIDAVNANLTFLAVIGIITSVISAYYYLRVLVYAFMKEDTYGFVSMKILSISAILVLAIATVLFGILPSISWEYAVQASNNLFSSNIFNFLRII
ncbi:MAG: NADH-quinone oxidoreductase subunit NuoN [Candidatus Dadabacteria bacterium]|nr:NADH-quinone oxidoreductase subunit NuoN [Candidatus Dadabacteria bacterium]NIQ14222.1 NADH-quinone oxidoreductase subunit NuoN [Candidatus Dadabacteria bacterium]